ncbi:MAG: hypothetical protein K1X71_15170 [Pirellulales bacterium]|nr:hypothetical protein [Pirellulales bacterium]
MASARHILARGARWLAVAGMLTLTGPLPTAAQQLVRVAPGVAAQLERFRIRVEDGRIVASNDVPGGRTTFAARSLGRDEKLSIDLTGIYPELEYTVVTRKSRVNIILAAGAQVRATAHPQGSKSSVVPLEFVQQPGEPVRLTLGADGEQQTWQASTLWHLLLAEPKRCEDHLLPVFHVVRPDWNLSQQANEIQRKLLEFAGSYTPPNFDQVARLVAQLADENFGRREQAEDGLRESPATLIAYLQTIDQRTLDAEQRFRLRRIVGAAERARQEDIPLVVAQRFVADRAAWLALLSRSDESLRHRAADHLAVLLGRPLDFDPRASVDERSAALDVLRAELLPRATSSD